jgi:hypothetical protein
MKARYAIEVLCDRCAAQPTWAHQNRGDTWKSIHRPCVTCQPVVAGFATPTPNPHWRRILQFEPPVSAAPPITMAENEIQMWASSDAPISLLATTGVK